MICLTFVNGLRSPFVDRPIKIMGSTIKASQEKVLLGVRFDNDLTFKEHVTSICSKTNQKLHVLTRVSKYLLLQMHHIPIKSFITSLHSSTIVQYSRCVMVEVLIIRLPASLKDPFVLFIKSFVLFPDVNL